MFQEYDFETRFKQGVLNVLPHELSHMYEMVLLDHGRKSLIRTEQDGEFGLLVAWDHLVMDFIGLFLTTERGYMFILIIVDVLTRFVILKPVQDKRAITVAYVLVNVFTNFGILKILQSDNKKSFMGKVMQALRGIAGFEMRKIMNYFPRQNGVIERYVQEAKNVLKKWIKGCVDKWECYVPAAQMGLND